MKNKLIALFLLLALMFCFTGCGEHIDAINPGGGNTSSGGNNDGGNDNPGGGNTSSGEETTDIKNTVTVMLEGSVYTGSSESDRIMVRWTDGKTSYTAPLGEDGRAEMTGLDGDYTVTLLNVPDGYSYNPNIYKTTNDKRDIRIELITLTKTVGEGSGLYKCISIKRTGTYRANIKKEGEIIYYEFKPTRAGLYIVESMMDISAEMYNPILKVYTGTTAAKFEQDEVDGGGTSAIYTKNFLYKINVAEEFLGNVFTFAVRVEGKDAEYPTYVDFTVAYGGAATDRYDPDASIMIPEFIPGELNYFDMLLYDTIDPSLLTEEDKSNATYAWLKAYREYLKADMDKFGSSWIVASERVGTTNVFNDDSFRLNPADGYYHHYDEVRYAATDGWGPILYAEISVTSSVLGSNLSTIEYAGNKTLTVSEGEENYKLFVEGSYELTLSHGDSGPYFCNSDCDCYKAYNTERLAFLSAVSAYKAALDAAESDLLPYANAIREARKRISYTNGGFCDSRCTDCNKTCRKLPLENAYQMGYANIAIDGRVAVTEELKIFLQKLAESQRYFSDGNGWIETQGYTAFEDSQWLFLCGYYR